MFFDFQTKSPVSNFLYACLVSNSVIWVDKRKEGLKTQFIYQLSKFFSGILQSCWLPYCAFKLFFLLFEWLFDAKVLHIGHAVKQNYVFVVFQSEATENNSHSILIKHVKEAIVMKIFK